MLGLTIYIYDFEMSLKMDQKYLLLESTRRMNFTCAEYGDKILISAGVKPPSK